MAALHETSPESLCDDQVVADVCFLDAFEDSQRPGAVVGSRASSGERRRGVDAERVMTIDHGALRIRPSIDGGWARSQLSYGPLQREAGLILGVAMLNGHNTSQWEPLPESLRRRLQRWAIGHGSRRALPRRALQWLRYKRKRDLYWKLRWWRRMARPPFVPLDENLAIGWFPDEALRDPLQAGASFVMHAAKGDNGELWARVGDDYLPVLKGVPNIPLVYAIALRERGAAYYVAAAWDTPDIPAYPLFVPVAIDAGDASETIFPSVSQAALGQIGFRVDSRVYGVQVTREADPSGSSGTASAADDLRGYGSLQGTLAAAGGRWAVAEGSFHRTPAGAHGGAGRNIALIGDVDSPALIHVAVDLSSDVAADAGIVWRYKDANNYCSLTFSRAGARAQVMCDGTITADVISPAPSFLAGATNMLQVQDLDGRVLASLNGRTLFRTSLEDAGPAGTGAVGLLSTGAAARFTSFEAHPRRVDLSEALTLELPSVPIGGPPVVVDDFDGPDGLDLAQRTTPMGGRRWRREFGQGVIQTRDDGWAAVAASRAAPNPGSTAYTIPWDMPEYVDVAVDILPPGNQRGDDERGRAGLVVWEDGRNFLTISAYLDDSYDGASIAIFSNLDGFEDIYDAVWSMVGNKITWGTSHRLRVQFDGMHLKVSIDDEPVLYRALSDIYPLRRAMKINRIGLAVNWEWGDDTGSRFRNFAASAREVVS